MNRLTYTLLLTALSLPAWAQSQFSTLEEQMTGKEFTAAGLGKLSAEELTALNEWLRAHSVATLDEARVPTGDTRGFEDAALAAMDGGDIVSRVKGPFRGWDGNTVFTLENGMIWKQTETSTFAIAEVAPGHLAEVRSRLNGPLPSWTNIPMCIGIRPKMHGG